MIVLVDYLKEKPIEQSVIWFNENFVYKSLLLSPKLNRTSLLVKVCLQLFVFNWPFSTTFSCHQKKCTFYFLPINRKKAGTVNTLLLVNAPERKGQNARKIEICTLYIWTSMYLSSNTIGCFQIPSMKKVLQTSRIWNTFDDWATIALKKFSYGNLPWNGQIFPFCSIVIDNCPKRQLPQKTIALKDNWSRKHLLHSRTFSKFKPIFP